MKKFLLLTLMLLSLDAKAYNTNGGSNPPGGSPDWETKNVVKSVTSGFSDAISRGDILIYDTVNSNDGYTVTRVANNDVATAARIACIAIKDIATGNTGLVPCLTKGWVDFLKYSLTSGQIISGQKLCSSSTGAAVPCAACVNNGLDTNDCRLGSATANSPITSFQSKNTGTSGTDLKAYINAR